MVSSEGLGWSWMRGTLNLSCKLPVLGLTDDRQSLALQLVAAPTRRLGPIAGVKVCAETVHAAQVPGNALAALVLSGLRDQDEAPEKMRRTVREEQASLTP